MKKIIAQINQYTDNVIESFVDNQLDSGAWNDEISGGYADKYTPRDFDRAQLVKGLGVELEHTSDLHKALEIVMDHLTESPIYYDHLEDMEKTFEED